LQGCLAKRFASSGPRHCQSALRHCGRPSGLPLTNSTSTLANSFVGPLHDKRRHPRVARSRPHTKRYATVPSRMGTSASPPCAPSGPTRVPHCKRDIVFRCGELTNRPHLGLDRARRSTPQPGNFKRRVPATVEAENLGQRSRKSDAVGEDHIASSARPCHSRSRLTSPEARASLAKAGHERVEARAHVDPTVRRKVDGCVGHRFTFGIDEENHALRCGEVPDAEHRGEVDPSAEDGVQHQDTCWEESERLPGTPSLVIRRRSRATPSQCFSHRLGKEHRPHQHDHGAHRDIPGSPIGSSEKRGA
jgi:hypothetical protein